MLPPADQCEDEWLKFLQYIGRRLNRQGVLLPTSDLHSLLVSRHAESLRPYFRFVVPEMGRLMRIVNKRWQYEDAAAAGIAIPQVHFPESVADAARLRGTCPTPACSSLMNLIPRKKLGGKLVVVHSGGELVERYESITAMKVALMIQELIRGPETDLVTHMAFWDADGCERAWLTTRKLRQSPPSFGDGCLQITADIPEVPELSRKLLRALCYTGFVGVEFKYDARDNTHRLIEINPRTMLGNQLAITAGIDLPWIGYQYLTGAESIPPEPFRRGVKWVNEEGDIQTFLALWKAGQINPSQWLDSLRGVESESGSGPGTIRCLCLRGSGASCGGSSRCSCRSLADGTLSPSRAESARPFSPKRTQPRCDEPRSWRCAGVWHDRIGNSPACRQAP